MKRHYYVISRTMSREVLVFDSREDIRKWFEVEPVDGFIADCNHQNVDDIREYRYSRWIPCVLEEARHWWSRDTLKELNDYTLCECLYTGVTFYAPCY